jgi:tetratricopeptide (TPR) repeat protein
MPAETALSTQGQDDWLPIGRLDVTVDPDDRELGRRLYKEHLQNVVLAAKDRGIPVLLTTVASNTRGHLDNSTPGKPTDGEQQALHELHGMAGSVQKARFAAEASTRRKLIQTEAGWHKLGNLYLKTGMVEIAADAFERKELAALRPMTSNRALRTVVKTLSKRHNVPMCDLAGALAQVAEHGIPGDAQFIDHCHPNANGHVIMGRALADCILSQDLLGLGIPMVPEWTPTNNPFRIDHFSGHRPIPGSKTNLSPGDPSTAEGQAMRGHQAFVTERYDRALQAYQEAQSLGGDAEALDISMGLTHLFRGDMLAAKAALQRAVDAGSADAAAHLAVL